MNPLRQLHQLGQSIWMDYIRRSLIQNGDLRRLIDDDGLSGVTVNPTILEKAIGWSGPIYKAHAKGCPKCGGSGYKGRVGIHELMITNDELVQGINEGAEAAELKKMAIRAGMKTLHQDSLIKVREGLTTLEEAIATVPPDL